jgi:hypothetical protein
MRTLVAPTAILLVCLLSNFSASAVTLNVTGLPGIDARFRVTAVKGDPQMGSHRRTPILPTP